MILEVKSLGKPHSLGTKKPPKWGADTPYEPSKGLHFRYTGKEDDRGDHGQKTLIFHQFAGPYTPQFVSQGPFPQW